MFGGNFGAFRSANRHCFDESSPIYVEISRISQLRKRHIALRRGRQYLRKISSDGQNFSIPHVVAGGMKSTVAWSRIFAEREILLAINTDTESLRTALVAIDPELHSEGDTLQCVYQYPVGTATDGNIQTKVLAINEKAVHITPLSCGFAMYV
jgi:ABC-type histidine transport system ATPase subunit